MVSRGEMTTDEAKKFVEDLMKQAQQRSASESGTGTTPGEPRRIEILSEDEEQAPSESQDQNVDKLRQQVLELREELRRLQRDK